jgi:phosphoserine phosphatase RsbU/P
VGRNLHRLGGFGLTRLRGAFTLTIALSYLVIGSLTVVAFLLSARGMIAAFGTRFAVTQALLEKNRVLSRIDREVALAEKLVDDPLLVRWATAEKDPALRALAMEELESYRRVFASHSYFIALDRSKHYYVYDSSAAVKGLQLATLSAATPADKWYFDTLRAVESFALNLDYNRTINSIRVWINAVIKDKTGAKIGIGGTGIDLSDFLTEVLQSGQKDVTTILVDRAGAIEAHPTLAYVQRNATAPSAAEKLTIYDLLPQKEEGERLRAALDALAMGRSQVESLPLLMEGRRYLAAAAFMPEIGWYNLVLVDTTGVVGPADFLPLGATIVASLLLVLLAVALTLSRAVLRPLSALAAASREISGGRYGVRLPVTRSDEIGQLTRSFNEMSETVRDATVGLEKKVSERTQELTESNRALESSQALIMESLSYARRLQGGILPPEELLRARLADSFVMYVPRDVVGGDFYSFRAFADHSVAAVVDCMGHGVPGAFMTMSAHAVLAHVLDSVCNEDPSRILVELDKSLRETLHARGVDRRLDAGLDIALCVWRPDGRVSFAGAGLPLYYRDGATVGELKGERRRVGYQSPRSEPVWTNQTLHLGPDACVYLTTDGFIDQSGGEKGFGFGGARFAALIQSCSSIAVRDQAEVFRRSLGAYQGAGPQRDDITVFAFSIQGGRGS